MCCKHSTASSVKAKAGQVLTSLAMERMMQPGTCYSAAWSCCRWTLDDNVIAQTALWRRSYHGAWHVVISVDGHSVLTYA